MVRRFNHFYSTSRQASIKNIHWFHFTNHYKGLYLCDKLVTIITCKLCADFATETELLIYRHEFAWIQWSQFEVCMTSHEKMANTLEVRQTYTSSSIRT